MIELSLEYINQLASQIMLISTFLGGFSITTLTAILLSDKEGKLLNVLFVSTVISAASFIIAIFAMTSLIMFTTPGYPMAVTDADMMLPRFGGILAFLVGILSLVFMIGLSGWLKSRKLGIVTTILAAITLIVFLLMNVRFG